MIDVRSARSFGTFAVQQYWHPESWQEKLMSQANQFYQLSDQIVPGNPETQEIWVPDFTQSSAQNVAYSQDSWHWRSPTLGARMEPLAAFPQVSSWIVESLAPVPEYSGVYTMGVTNMEGDVAALQVSAHSARSVHIGDPIIALDASLRHETIATTRYWRKSTIAFRPTSDVAFPSEIVILRLHRPAHPGCEATLEVTNETSSSEEFAFTLSGFGGGQGRNVVYSSGYTISTAPGESCIELVQGVNLRLEIGTVLVDDHPLIEGFRLSVVDASGPEQQRAIAPEHDACGRDLSELVNGQWDEFPLTVSAGSRSPKLELKEGYTTRTKLGTEFSVGGISLDFGLTSRYESLATRKIVYKLMPSATYHAYNADSDSVGGTDLYRERAWTVEPLP